MNISDNYVDTSLHYYKSLGSIKKITLFNDILTINLHDEIVKILFYKNEMIRVIFSPNGNFYDPTKNKIIFKQYEEYKNNYKIKDLQLKDLTTYYEINTDKIILRINKNPFKLSVINSQSNIFILEEKEPLKYNDNCIVQTLHGYKNEFFYGCGVQNGYFSHKGKKIHIAVKASHWNDGSVSNPAPFYMSTKCYGAFRNTFNPGTYDFTKDSILSHNDKIFDCFYFFHESFKDILNNYTELTGRPTLIPRWGFSSGDANCYKETMDALNVAKNYDEFNMPKGWILPNDGYGCGYTNLSSFITEAEKLGFKVGLWTENSVDKISEEVYDFGSRVVKTDVAWVGPGYEFALDGVKLSYEGIENNCNSRGYVWTVCGWAGTQRYSTVWTGDQSGDFEYIRMHIPTYIGAGLSGMPYIGSDIDGIFGGSPHTQVRDLQWKAFTPILINMSGWAKHNKQPWVFGEPYTSYNRYYLNLKQRLTPYMYTYANKSYETGSPIMRAMVFQYPNDKYTWAKNTQYQFMLGDYFLVAPVYEDSNIRNEIYLPDENQWWIDYFTGEQYKGGQVINNLKAPLSKLPLLVKKGAIIPMYPQCNFDSEKVPDENNPITFDIYPCGESSFELYEDDGNSKEHRKGVFSKTLINCLAPNYGMGNAIITINETQGSYNGIKEIRKNEFIIHTKINPNKILLNFSGVTTEFMELHTKESFLNCTTNCWFFDDSELLGLLYIKTEPISIRCSFKIILDKFQNDVILSSTIDEVLPTMPKNFKSLNIKEDSITLSWTINDSLCYYDLLVDGMLFSNVISPFVHKDLDALSNHNYKLRARNSLGVSSWSSQVMVTTLESSLKNIIPSDEILTHATSFEENYESFNAVDGDPHSMWHSKFEENAIPATFNIELKNPYKINKFQYVGRPNNSNGNITKYNLSISQNGIHYKSIVNNGVWSSSSPNIVEFNEDLVTKYLKIEILEGNGNYAAATHFKIYKTPGTDKVLLGDYTGDGNIDTNDLTFIKNYIGVSHEDNDWCYVHKCDINYNGIIDAYDLAFLSSKIDDKLIYSGKSLNGSLHLTCQLSSVAKGETFTVNLVGDNLSDVYAFHGILNLDTTKFQHLNCTGRCQKDVIAKSSDLSCHMINASTIKEDNNKVRLIIAFSCKGNSTPINSTGILATFTLKAKEDTDINLKLTESMIVGTNLDFI